jgi:hypothetical protein
MTDVNKGFSKELKEVRDYEAYIVHFMYVQEEKPAVKWGTFVEKYVFRNVSDQEG